jgi:hypothetical protein
MTGARNRDWLFMCTLAAIAMAYGWGYRGVVGHEGGAMVPGAMLGLAVCLGSRRADWRRRAAVAGLFGAAGWSWGGSLSYMEHTMFAISDSWPDVLFGYAMLFFLGALWAGIGGAILGLAFTLKRSQLESLARVFVTMSAAFLTTYLYMFFNGPVKEAYEQFTADRFHDGDWLPAVTVLFVAAIHGITRRKDRHAAALFFACAASWWVFYLGLTKFGGLVLAPPFRSESWGGVVGILVALVVYLARTKNRAALMLCMYGILGGGLAFMFAVFVRHPVRVAWWPIASVANQLPQWKIAEESFGLFMGLAIALGVARLERGGLAPADDDTPRKPLDIFAAFVMLVALMWVNLRRAPMDWIHRYKAIPNEPVLGTMPWVWFTVGGFVLSAIAVYALWLYANDRLALAPASAHGKGAFILILLVWITMIGSFVQTFPADGGGFDFFMNASFIVFGAIVTAMLSNNRATADAPGARVPPADSRWRVGRRYAALCASVPVLVVLVSGLSMAMQNGPVEGARLRFGPNAYWREQSAMIGTWIAIGFSTDTGAASLTTDGLDVQTIEFQTSRNVVLVLRDGKEIAHLHRWHYMNSMTHLDWNDRAEDPSKCAEAQIVLRNGRMFIPWPPDQSTGLYLVLDRLD